MLLNALRATGAVQCSPPLIHPPVLAAVLASWANALEQPVLAATLPSWLALPTLGIPTTVAVLTKLIASAVDEIVVNTPYMDREGVLLLIEALRDATARGVQLTIATHHLDDPGSPNARALAALRAEVPVKGVNFPSFVGTTEGPQALLVHAKLVIADQHTALIGSANLTRAGLNTNIEVGVVVHGSPASRLRQMWQRLLEEIVKRHSGA